MTASLAYMVIGFVLPFNEVYIFRETEEVQVYSLVAIGPIRSCAHFVPDALIMIITMLRRV